MIINNKSKFKNMNNEESFKKLLEKEGHIYKYPEMFSIDYLNLKKSNSIAYLGKNVFDFDENNLEEFNNKIIILNFIPSEYGFPYFFYSLIKLAGNGTEDYNDIPFPIIDAKLMKAWFEVMQVDISKIYFKLEKCKPEPVKHKFGITLN